MVSHEEIIKRLRENDKELTSIEWDSIDDADVTKLFEVIKTNTHCRNLKVTDKKNLSVDGEKKLFEIHKVINLNLNNYETVILPQLKKEQEKAKKAIEKSEKVIKKNLGRLNINEDESEMLFTSNTLSLFNSPGKSKNAVIKKFDKSQASGIAENINQRPTSLEIIQFGYASTGTYGSNQGSNQKFIFNDCIIKSIVGALQNTTCKIKELYLKNCQIKPTTLADLFKAIGDNQSLIILDLSNYYLKESYDIEVNSKRNSSKMKIAPVIIKNYLIPALAKNKVLRVLDLTGRILNSENVLELLKINKNLQILNVDSYKKDYYGHDYHVDYDAAKTGYFAKDAVRFNKNSFYKKLSNLLENNFTLCNLDIVDCLRKNDNNNAYSNIKTKGKSEEIFLKQCQQILDRNKALATKSDPREEHVGDKLNSNNNVNFKP